MRRLQRGRTKCWYVWHMVEDVLNSVVGVTDSLQCGHQRRRETLASTSMHYLEANRNSLRPALSLASSRARRRAKPNPSQIPPIPRQKQPARRDANEGNRPLDPEYNVTHFAYISNGRFYRISFTLRYTRLRPPRPCLHAFCANSHPSSQRPSHSTCASFSPCASYLLLSRTFSPHHSPMSMVSFSGQESRARAR